MIGCERHRSVPRAVAVGLAIGALAWLGCGEDGGEAKLEAARQELAKARDEVSAARVSVEEQDAVVKAAREELEKRRAALSEDEARLAAAEQAIDVEATDAVLFRAIQKQLLEDDDLDEFAIAARVEGGAVVLTGRVTNAKLRDRAVSIARSAPGVASVESRIEVVERQRAE